jgi:lipopolysaccharide biosynthesis protein
MHAKTIATAGELSMLETSAEMKHAIAVLLPQFHPIPENDDWWGRGFTEWRNVAKARPLFDGHEQPRLPADLGFYDLRLADSRAAQAELARAHGISGFCYYHYWFNGRRLLERPFDEVLLSGKPDFPFCLCWANENWTRVWNGGDRDVLMAQHYSEEDDEAHMRALVPALADRRYIRIDDKPLLIVYRVSHMTEPRRRFDCWRETALREGLGELILAQFESFGEGHADTLREQGLDLSIEFAPDWRRVGPQRT